MAKFGTTLSRLTFGQMSPQPPLEALRRLTPGREILWPCVWQLWSHRTNVLPSPSRDISWPSFVLLWASWPSVRSTPHMRHQARSAFGQMSGQVNIMSDVCPLPLTEKVIWTWKDDWPHGWLLHHERPFTQEGYYLVIAFYCKSVPIVPFVKYPAHTRLQKIETQCFLVIQNKHEQTMYTCSVVYTMLSPYMGISWQSADRKHTIFLCNS